MFGSKKERDELILQLLNDTAELKETIDYQKYQIKKTGEFGKWRGQKWTSHDINVKNILEGSKINFSVLT